jgi:hypothetical protein
MAILTLEECKTLLGIQDDPDLVTTCEVTQDSDVITAIPDTTGIRAGNTVNTTGIIDALVLSIPSGTSIKIDSSAPATDLSAPLTISNRGSEYDELITLYIPIAEATIQEYCNDKFSKGFPLPLKPIAAKMVWQSINNQKNTSGVVKAESIGRYSVTYASASEGISSSVAPEGIAILNLYKRMRFI